MKKYGYTFIIFLCFVSVIFVPLKNNTNNYLDTSSLKSFSQSIQNLESIKTPQEYEQIKAAVAFIWYHQVADFDSVYYTGARYDWRTNTYIKNKYGYSFEEKEDPNFEQKINQFFNLRSSIYENLFSINQQESKMLNIFKNKTIKEIIQDTKKISALNETYRNRLDTFDYLMLNKYYKTANNQEQEHLNLADVHMKLFPYYQNGLTLIKQNYQFREISNNIENRYLSIYRETGLEFIEKKIYIQSKRKIEEDLLKAEKERNHLEILDRINDRIDFLKKNKTSQEDLSVCKNENFRLENEALNIKKIKNKDVLIANFTVNNKMETYDKLYLSLVFKDKNNEYYLQNETHISPIFIKNLEKEKIEIVLDQNIIKYEKINLKDLFLYKIILNKCESTIEDERSINKLEKIKSEIIKKKSN